MANHHNSSNKKQKTRHSNSSSSSDRDDRSLDHSLIGEAVNLGQKNVAQIACALANGTQEVKDLLLNECNIIYECRLCKNMFRSFANLVAHKRIYCKDHQCEQMMLYDPAWFVPEGENNDIKVEVTREKEPFRNPKITFPPKLDSKTVELKRNSLHSLVNSLQKETQNDDSDTKPISTSQFSSKYETQKDETKSNSTQSQQLTLQSLSMQTSASLASNSTEESPLKTETSNQNSSEEIILFTKSSTDDVINPKPILKESSTSDHNEVQILEESLLPPNQISASSKAQFVTPTPIVCKKNKQNKQNRYSLLKNESSNDVQKVSQFSEMKQPQTLKTVKPVWNGSNAYGSLLNHHYRNNQSQFLSKESASAATTSSSSTSSSIQTNSNFLECPEQVCTEIRNISNCNDAHEQPISKSSIPIEVIIIDSDNDDDAHSDEIYAL